MVRTKVASIMAIATFAAGLWRHECVGYPVERAVNLDYLAVRWHIVLGTFAIKMTVPSTVAPATVVYVRLLAICRTPLFQMHLSPIVQ